MKKAKDLFHLENTKSWISTHFLENVVNDETAGAVYLRSDLNLYIKNSLFLVTSSLFFF